jgi:uncharacterized iron-regulated membrane protein
MPLQARVATKPGTEIPSDGGILVATTWTTSADKPMSENPVQPGWRLRGKTLTAPKIDVLAPGLAVYRVAFDGQAAMELENEQHEVVVNVTASTVKPAAIPVPKVKSIVYTATLSRHSSQTATATLTADPPAGAVAIVIVDDKGEATSWGGVVPGRVQTPYSHADCAMLPNGSSAPGGTVTTFWVMADGRRSEPSKAIKITTKFPKPNPY